MANKAINLIKELFRLPVKFDVDAAWDEAVKSTTGRLDRGNISVRNRRIRTKEASKREHERAVQIAQQWRRRANEQT